jgi:hypothetical protein
MLQTKPKLYFAIERAPQEPNGTRRTVVRIMQGSLVPVARAHSSDPSLSDAQREIDRRHREWLETSGAVETLSYWGYLEASLTFASHPDNPERWHASLIVSNSLSELQPTARMMALVERKLLKVPNVSLRHIERDPEYLATALLAARVTPVHRLQWHWRVDYCTLRRGLIAPLSISPGPTP